MPDERLLRGAAVHGFVLPHSRQDGPASSFQVESSCIGTIWNVLHTVDHEERPPIFGDRS